jgi:hypothetical protein
VLAADPNLEVGADSAALVDGGRNKRAHRVAVEDLEA